MSLRNRMGAVAGIAVALTVIGVAVTVYVAVRSELYGQVDATLNERCDLTPEGSTSLLKGGLTQGFYANPEWSD